jgi:serine/threonine protein kinase
MELAATVIKVPKVYQYGYSGNCSFILMEYIHGVNLQALVNIYGRGALRKVEHELCMIVRNLSMVGISHNDLYPRNILVNENWSVVAVIDWDESGPLINSREYARRACWGHDTHDWDFIFLGNSLDPFDHLDLNPNSELYAMPSVVRYPLDHIIAHSVNASAINAPAAHHEPPRAQTSVTRVVVPRSLSRSRARKKRQPRRALAEVVGDKA